MPFRSRRSLRLISALSGYSGPCPPCRVVVHKRCHCGQPMSLSCPDLSEAQMRDAHSASSAAMDALLSCGKVCHKRLPNCKHTCRSKCHPGECPSPELCDRKVTVRCSCGRQKMVGWWRVVVAQVTPRPQQVRCYEVQAAAGAPLICCDDECERNASEQPETQTTTTATVQPSQKPRKRKNKKSSTKRDFRKKVRGFTAKQWAAAALVVVLMGLAIFGLLRFRASKQLRKREL